MEKGQWHRVAVSSDHDNQSKVDISTSVAISGQQAALMMPLGCDHQEIPGDLSKQPLQGVSWVARV